MKNKISGKTSQAPGKSDIGLIVLRRKTQNAGINDRQDSKETIISIGTKLTGTITTGDNLRIQGEFEGRIMSQDTVSVDVTGKVHADIFALNIFIAGEVIGNMNAKERFELLSTGSVVGEVKAAKISIMDSACVKGKIEVGNIKEIPGLKESST